MEAATSTSGQQEALRQTNLKEREKEEGEEEKEREKIEVEEGRRPLFSLLRLPLLLLLRRGRRRRQCRRQC